jgi:predicted DNA-binding transcriptional regulator AlpA
VVENDLDNIRVLSRRETIKAANLSERTWERLEAVGDVPLKTRLSQGRIGYRVADIKEWLDRRREGGVRVRRDKATQEVATV